MRTLQEDDEEAYKRQFSRYIKEGITADTVEESYKKAHDAIRANPDRVQKEAKKDGAAKPVRYNKKKLTLAARKNKVVLKKKAVIARLDAEAKTES